MLGNGLEGVFVQFRPLDDGRPFVQEPGQGAQEPRLALPALAEQDHVMPGDQGTLKLGKHGPTEAVQSWPWILTGRERGEQVSTDFLAQVLEDVAGGAQFTNGENIGTMSHHYTVAPQQLDKYRLEDFFPASPGGALPLRLAS